MKFRIKFSDNHKKDRFVIARNRKSASRIALNQFGAGFAVYLEAQS